MAVNRIIKQIGAIALAVGVFHGTVCSAFMFTVNLDPSALNSQPGSPFFIDFQLIDGTFSGDGNNTVTISGFNFGTGNAGPGAPTYLGGASGSLLTSITLTDNTAPGFGNPAGNEFRQQFTPGDALSFTVSVNPINIDVGFPDTFSFFIYNALGNPIPTTDPGDSLVYFDLNSASPTVNSFATAFSSGPQIGQPGVSFPSSVVPEPSVTVFFAFGGLIMVPYWLRKRRLVKLRV